MCVCVGEAGMGIEIGGISLSSEGTAFGCEYNGWRLNGDTLWGENVQK